jgi:AcrR family transcriptional regulator
MWSNIISLPKLSRIQQIWRDDIIMAAITVINRDGYASATMERVAKQADTSKGTVLYHFKSKRSLETAIVNAVYEAGASYMIPQITTTRGHRRQILAYISTNLHFIVEHKEQVAAVQQIAKNTPLIDKSESAILSLEQLLREGLESGELTGFDPHTLAVAIRLIIDGSAFYILDTPSLDSDSYIQEIVRLFEKSIA